MSSSAFRPAIESIDPPEINKSPFNAQLVRVPGNTALIHTAGQMPIDLNGKVPASYPDQIRLCLQNLDACLKSAGAVRKDIVKLTYFIVNYDAANRAHAPLLSEYLQGHRPATTLVPVPALARPDLLFEIEATAVVPDPSARSGAGNSRL